MTATETRPSSVVESAAAAGGGVLRAFFGTVGRLRPSGKPLHPRGIVLRATVHRFGGTEPYGVEWLDVPGQDEAAIRLSRGVGLPDFLPDVLGLAVRVDPHGRPGDLLFATTGHGLLTRFVLLPRRAKLVTAQTYTTLLPYRTPTGPVVLEAAPQDAPDGGLRIALRVARPTGRWQDFGAIEVASLDDLHDGEVTFDPVLNTLAGLEPYGWWGRLREGAYSAARHTRGEADPDAS